MDVLNHSNTYTGKGNLRAQGKSKKSSKWIHDKLWIGKEQLRSWWRYANSSSILYTNLNKSH